MSLASQDGQSFWFSRPAAREWRCEPVTTAAGEFHRGIPGYRRTALTEAPGLAGELGMGRVFVKDESSRFGLPAFKALGASWAIATLLADRAGLSGPLTMPALREAAAADPLTLVTATDGNHGRAVAHFAQLLGLGAHVFVPDVISDHAAAAIAGEGAQVTVVHGSYDDAVAAAAAAAAGPGAELVQDNAWPGYEQVPGRIVEGYHTMLAEISDQLAAGGLAQPDLVAVPFGVGSLAQAVLAYYRSLPGPERAGGAPSVLSCEPETAACALASLQAGQPVTVPTAATVMAGLNCGTVSSLAWPYLRDGCDAAVAVPDHAAVRAVVDLAGAGVAAGASGAASLACVRAVLTGPGADSRRGDLGLGPGSVLVLLSTEGPGGAGG
jgi:diaminopropionate ammonia-lyase